MVSTTHTPRITGGCSLHAEFDPQKCPKDNPALAGEPCGHARCVDCCKQTPDKDIDECSRCGRQRQVACYFDDEMA